MKETLPLLLAFLIATIGSVIKYWLDNKKEYQNNIRDKRREMYQEFVDVLITALTSRRNNKDLNMSASVVKLDEVYKKYILYASPKVIEAYSNLFQFVYCINEAQKDNKDAMMLKSMTKVLKVMRADLGLSNSKLGDNGEVLMKALLTDYNRVKWK